MARVTLHPGAWTSTISLIGAGAVTVAPAWSTAWIWGWISITFGTALFAWAIRIDYMPWWTSFFSDNRTKSPIIVANLLFVDSQGVVDEHGVDAADLISLNLQLQVASDRKDGASVQNVTAFLESGYGDRAQLAFRNGTIYLDKVNLLDGKIEFLELGYVVVPAADGAPNAPLRMGRTKRQLLPGHLDIHSHDAARDYRRFRVGDGSMAFHDGTSFRILICAENERSFRMTLKTDLTAHAPHRWLRATGRKAP